MLNEQQIKEIVTDYFKDKPMKRIYLFGCYAWGEARRDSDIDLGIELEDVKMSIWQYIGLAIGLEEIIKTKIDIV